jgi:glycosyltransferase involved in cell wall biosynthesis
MKIGMVGNIPEPVGGAEVFTESLINGLAKNNFEIILARWKKRTFEYPGHSRKYIYRYEDVVKISNSFKIYSVFQDPSKFQPMAWLDIIIQGLKLAKIFKIENVDIVHCHLLHPEIYFSFIAAKVLRKPLVVTIHGLIDFSTLPGYSRYYRRFIFKLLVFILKMTDKVVAVSEEIKEVCLRHNIKNVEKICCGINLDYFHPKNALKEEGILYIGKVDPNKGIYVLIRAYKNILDKVSDDLFLVGRGLDENTRINKDMILTEEVKSIIESNRIHFAGRKNRVEILELINKSKVIVLPSFSEGLPLAILEAMACGKVVVASRVGELKQIIKDGKNGFLIEPGNAEQLSATLVKVLNNFGRYKAMGLEAQKTANNFKIEKAIKAYIIIYKNLIDDKKLMHVFSQVPSIIR